MMTRIGVLIAGALAATIFGAVVPARAQIDLSVYEAQYRELCSDNDPAMREPCASLKSSLDQLRSINSDSPTSYTPPPRSTPRPTPTTSAADRYDWSKSEYSTSLAAAQTAIQSDVRLCKFGARTEQDVWSCDTEGKRILDKKIAKYGTATAPLGSSRASAPIRSQQSPAINQARAGSTAVDETGKMCGTAEKLGKDGISTWVKFINNCSQKVTLRWGFITNSNPGGKIEESADVLPGRSVQSFCLHSSGCNGSVKLTAEWPR